MRGTILQYDGSVGTGLISGDDDNRYGFVRDDLRQSPVAPGARVDFRIDATEARDIYLLDEALQPAQAAAAPAGDIYSGEDMGLFEYFRRAITERYVAFTGRARRKEYWGFALFALLGAVAVLILGLVLDMVAVNGDGAPMFTIILSSVYWLGLLLPGLSIMVRRLHDIGLSGWFVLVNFIPYIGGLVMLVFALLPSQERFNKWGQVPYPAQG